MKRPLLILFVLLFTISFSGAQDLPYNDEVYQSRVEQYRQEYYNNGNKNSLPLQAYLKQPIN